MSWLRKGDTAHQHRCVSAILEHPDCDDRLLNEVYGWFDGVAEGAAARGSDYVITRGEALRAAGSPARGAQLIELALFAELFTETITTPSGRLEYKLINDPEFMHIRTAAEKAWEAQRQADSSNTSLTVPVRLRDGDACRYCAVVVIWGDTRSARGATYDNRERHRTGPGRVDIVVVACKACNAGRRDDPDADERYPLLPPPEHPYYHPKTVAWLAQHGHQVRAGFQPANAPRPRPGTQPDPARTTTRPRTQRDTAPYTVDTPARPAPGTAPPRPAIPADTAPGSPPEIPGPLTAEAGSAGSGRDGTGAARSTGRPRDAPQRRSRGRRGRRGASPPAQHTPPTGDPP